MEVVHWHNHVIKKLLLRFFNKEEKPQFEELTPIGIYSLARFLVCMETVMTLRSEPRPRWILQQISAVNRSVI